MSQSTPTAPSRTRLSPYEVIADYERRSLAHVVGLPEQLDAPGLWRGVGYRIGSHRLASGFDEVVEILPLPPVTPVPGAQPWMLGVANIRGNLLPIVDLKQFLEGERTVLHEGQRVLIVRQSGGDVAVTIDEFTEKEEKNLIVIGATIHTERDSHKGILIGKHGSMLKEIGKQAREELESLLGCRIFLELFVRVDPGWTQNPQALIEMGL